MSDTIFIENKDSAYKISTMLKVEIGDRQDAFIISSCPSALPEGQAIEFRVGTQMLSTSNKERTYANSIPYILPETKHRGMAI